MSGSDSRRWLRRSRGHVDNSSYPAINVNISMMLVMPALVKGPVPVLMMFGPADFPAPNEPSREEFAKINAALKALMVQQDPSLQEMFRAASCVRPGEGATPFLYVLN